MQKNELDLAIEATNKLLRILREANQTESSPHSNEDATIKVEKRINNENGEIKGVEVSITAEYSRWIKLEITPEFIRLIDYLKDNHIDVNCKKIKMDCIYQEVNMLFEMVYHDWLIFEMLPVWIDLKQICYQS